MSRNGLVPVTAVLLLVPLAGCMEAAALFSATDGPSLPEALVRADPYPRLVVEVDHVRGQEPCPSTLHLLRANLLYVTAKQDVQVVTTPIARAHGSYSNADLAQIHRSTLSHRVDAGQWGSGDAAVLHVVFLNGHAESSGGGHAAGRVLYEQGSIFVFKDSFRGAYTMEGGLRRDATCDVERTVVLHELGHALGIVNRGVPMLHDRESSDHPGHSENPESAMYPTLRIAADGRVVAPLPSGYDRHDLADLAAYRDG